ncbi:MAG: Gfo/Idh/MocA family oxidoreductase [Candidatus Bathyarchaeota archaeon]|nr:Gfo/Idh/MocA family oxidoreductase [Candidatus Bathyarchaeota archaeon]
MQVRVGVIGAGAVADITHLPAYHEMPEAELIAVCDINEERAKLMAKKYDAEAWYTDYLKLLQRADIDAVSICTPNYLHCDQTVAAAKHGKHVLVEKPMATTLEECDKMIDACKKANVKLMVGANPRFDPQNQQIKEILDRGFIGRILQIKYHAAYGGPLVFWPAVSDWFFDESKVGGGCIQDFGTHIIDLFRWFAGDVSSVFAIGGTLQKNIETEDNAILLLTFKRGGIGEIDISWTYKGWDMSAEIIGSEGAIFVREPHSPISIYTEKAGLNISEAMIQPQFRLDVAQMMASQKSKIKHFVMSIIEDKRPLVEGRDGKAALEVVLAAYESMKSGKKVLLK